MNSKRLYVGSKAWSNLILLPLPAKFALIIVLIFLTSAFVLVIGNIAFSNKMPTIFQFQVKGDHSIQSAQTQDLFGLTRYKESVSLKGKTIAVNPVKSIDSDGGPPPHYRENRSAIKVDQYPFFADEYDLSSY